MTDWNREKAQATYNITHWGADYFDINPQGQLCVYPLGNRSQPQAGPAVNLYDIANEAMAQGMRLPLLVRFTNILQSQVSRLCRSFQQAIQDEGYQGRYTAVYPIKVNQQHSVVEAILEGGNDCVGLEAGSKPELMAVLGSSLPSHGVIVCNGYKDREYIRLALIAQSLGHRVYIVIEKLSELALVLAQAAAMQIRPILGVRVRLASIGAGKWQNTGGEKSKFGLSAAQVLSLVSQLQQAGMVDCLQMLHFHLGSQLANIRDIQRGLHECARYFAELSQQGCTLKVVDVGGGLGVDYEGTRSRSPCSMNYSMASYASHIVHALKEICDQQDLPHPDIMTESGRAMTAHHAVLLTNVIDVEKVPAPDVIQPPASTAVPVVQELWKIYAGLQSQASAYAAIEAWHDIRYWMDEGQSLFTHGAVSLTQRAQVEEIYFACCRLIQAKLNPGQRSHQEVLEQLNEKLADKYFCNFSLFQSIPDSWAIEQIFPVMPLHQLDIAPTCRGVLEDITCDSDGRIDQYVEGEGLESSLPLHAWQPGDNYLLGIFMVGAYQEILGDMHNLFGDTDSLHVSVNEQGHQLDQCIKGDTVDSLLRYVHFKPDEVLQQYRARMNQADIPEQDKQTYLAELEAGLSGYTYLED